MAEAPSQLDSSADKTPPNPEGQQVNSFMQMVVQGLASTLSIPQTEARQRVKEIADAIRRAVLDFIQRLKPDLGPLLDNVAAQLDLLDLIDPLTLDPIIAEIEGALPDWEPVGDGGAPPILPPTFQPGYLPPQRGFGPPGGGGPAFGPGGGGPALGPGGGGPAFVPPQGGGTHGPSYLPPPPPGGNGGGTGGGGGGDRFTVQYQGGNVVIDVVPPVVDVAAPVVNVTVPPGPPPVVNFTAGNVNVTVPPEHGEGPPTIIVGPPSVTVTTAPAVASASADVHVDVAGSEAISQVDVESIDVPAPIIAAPRGRDLPGRGGATSAVVGRILGLPIPDWSGLNPCSAMQTTQHAVENWVRTLLPPVLHAVLLDSDEESKKAIEEATKDAPFWIRWLLRWLIGITVGAVRFVIGTLQHGECTVAQILPVLVVKWMWGFLERWTGLKGYGVDKTTSYWQQYLCPQEIPSLADTHMMWYAGVIDQDTWKCWVRANDFHWAPQEKVIQARRNRPGAQECIALWRRGVIGRPELDKRLRNEGFTDPVEADWVVSLTRQLPDFRTVVHLLGLNAFDADAVKQFGYDADLPAELPHQAAEYLKALGWSREEAGMVWRSRWEHPDIKTLLDATRRLRPGRVPPDLAVDDATVNQALVANLVPPYWRKRVLRLARQPMALRTIHQLYLVGILDIEPATERILDLGYEEAAAGGLLKFWDTERFTRAIKGRWVKAYLLGTLTEADLQEQLLLEGYAWPMMGKILKWAQDAATIQRRAKLVKCVERRYAHGEFVPVDAIALLVNQGLEGSRAVELVDSWTCQRKARAKEQPAATLCRWAQEGLISRELYEQRLLNLGYRADDAAAMVLDCAIRGEQSPKEPAPKEPKLPSPPKPKKPPPIKRPPPAKKTPGRGTGGGGRNGAQSAADARAAKAVRDRERLDAALVRLATLSSEVTGNSQGEDLTGVKRAVDDAVAEYVVTPLGAVAILQAVIQGVKHAKLTDWRPEWAAALTLLDKRPRGRKPQA